MVCLPAAVEKKATMTAEQLLDAVASAERERAASPGAFLPLTCTSLLLTRSVTSTLRFC